MCLYTHVYQCEDAVYVCLLLVVAECLLCQSVEVMYVCLGCICAWVGCVYVC